MLDQQELGLWADRFGVAADQIRRDHLISHLLVGLARSEVAERVVFFGGTALARTHLGDRRMSEDIDLWGTPTQKILAVLSDELPRYIRREFPGLRIERTSPEIGTVVTQEGIQVRLQVVSYGAEYHRCVRVERRLVALRYTDIPDQVELTVPVRASFVAMKHLAWTDRSAPRDLVDLAGLAAIGAMDHEANGIVECLRGLGPRPSDIDRVPERTQRAWIVDLAHQMGEPPDPERALGDVRQAWADCLGWD